MKYGNDRLATPREFMYREYEWKWLKTADFNDPIRKVNGHLNSKCDFVIVNYICLVECYNFVRYFTNIKFIWFEGTVRAERPEPIKKHETTPWRFEEVFEVPARGVGGVS